MTNKMFFHLPKSGTSTAFSLSSTVSHKFNISMYLSHIYTSEDVFNQPAFYVFFFIYIHILFFLLFILYIFYLYTNKIDLQTAVFIFCI